MKSKQPIDEELLKKIHEYKDGANMNSARVAMILGMPLRTVNKLFATSVPDPEAQAMWVEESMQ